MRKVLLLVLVAMTTTMTAASGKWNSPAIGLSLNYTTSAATGTAAKDANGKPMTIVYLENLGISKIGQNSNADDVAWLRSEGYRVFLLSNGNDLHFDFINRKYGLDAHFERLFLSQRMHMAKPEESIFLEVVQTIAAGWNGDGVYNPHCTLFVDDIETNRRAAEHYVGWQTCASLSQLTDKLNLPATYERPTQVYCSRSRAVYR